MLSQIAAKKRERVHAAKAKLPLTELKQRLQESRPLRPFVEGLQQAGISVIAEVKKASPSKGSFNLNMAVDALALQYEAGGARAVSVLTEEDFFLGCADDLTRVRQAIRLPVLRKDFVLDEYQLYESRLLQADAVLLIAGFLSEAQLGEYLAICEELGLEALVEAHNAYEVSVALAAGAAIVGINNRNLKTFQTDVNHTLTLAGLITPGVLLVSESGIRSAEDVEKLAAAGTGAILVGETLVRAKDPAAKIRELIGGALHGKN